MRVALAFLIYRKLYAAIFGPHDNLARQEVLENMYMFILTTKCL